jgi:hypothetical protein
LVGNTQSDVFNPSLARIWTLSCWRVLFSWWMKPLMSQIVVSGVR